MGILDSIVEWISEQIMNFLDLVTSSVLGAMGCNMDTFLRYFPAAETLYDIFTAMAIGFILLNLVWQTFRAYGTGLGIESEDPGKLAIKSFVFILLAFFAKDITDMALSIAGTPYDWILEEELPGIEFASFASTVSVIIASLTTNSVALITIILVAIIAWNYLKLLLEAAERYITVGILVFTAPMAIATGSSKATDSIFYSWCRMLGGQLFLLIMNAWCLKLFVSMVGRFMANPLSV